MTRRLPKMAAPSSRKHVQARRRGTRAPTIPPSSRPSLHRLDNRCRAKVQHTPKLTALAPGQQRSAKFLTVLPSRSSTTPHAQSTTHLQSSASCSHRRWGSPGTVGQGSRCKQQARAAGVNRRPRQQAGRRLLRQEGPLKPVVRPARPPASAAETAAKVVRAPEEPIDTGSWPRQCAG